MKPFFFFALFTISCLGTETPSPTQVKADHIEVAVPTGTLDIDFSADANLPTSTPTAQPSSAPTLIPTAESTASSTAQPSELPTAGPTVIPSPAPISTPTVDPSTQPTTLPTGTPSQLPTMPPTVDSSTKPTTLPVGTPSQLPTMPSTPGPSIDPTIFPTRAPSLTLAPTVESALTPSVMATPSATTLDSVEPTVAPSQRGYLPTALPSDAPTVDAIENGYTPTSMPTTTLPTTQYAPTFVPTLIPTTPPSSSPTLPPTLHWNESNATPESTLAPTALPSTRMPTGSPTNFETTIAPTVSADDTYLPTGSSTYESTSGPTALPTPAPSALPTVSPTPLPTEVPTINPTSEPSRTPTLPISTISPSTYPPTMRPTTFQPMQSPTATPTSIPLIFSASLVLDLGMSLTVRNSSIASVFGAAVVRAVHSIKSIDSVSLAAYSDSTMRRLLVASTAVALDLTGTAQTSMSNASAFVKDEISTAVSSGDLGSALLIEARAANVLNSLDDDTLEAAVLVNESIQMLANTLTVSDQMTTKVPSTTLVPTTPEPTSTTVPTQILEPTIMASSIVTKAPTLTPTTISAESSKKKKNTRHLTPVTIMIGIGLIILLFCVALPTLIMCYQTRMPKTVVHVERQDDVPPPMELDDTVPKPKEAALDYNAVFGEEEQSPLDFRRSPDVEAPHTPLIAPISQPTPPSRSELQPSPASPGAVRNETSVLSTEWEQMMNDVDGELEEEVWNEDVASLILFRLAATPGAPEGFAPRAQLTTVLNLRPDLADMLGLGHLSPSDAAELFADARTDADGNISRNQFIQAVTVYRNRFGVVDMDTVDSSATPPPAQYTPNGNNAGFGMGSNESLPPPPDSNHGSPAYAKLTPSAII